MPTPSGVSDNTPWHIWASLINGNPKTEIKRQEKTVLDLKKGFLAGHADPELRRIALRAAQEEEQYQQQAA